MYSHTVTVNMYTIMLYYAISLMPSVMEIIPVSKIRLIILKVISKNATVEPL